MTNPEAMSFKPKQATKPTSTAIEPAPSALKAHQRGIPDAAGKPDNLAERCRS